MKRTIFPLLAAGLVTTASSQAATVLSSWTFETNTPADLTDNTTSPSVVAESGVFTTGYVASGVHVSALTDWSTPTGNGSLNSFSTNNWAIGDYYQFSTSTVGYSEILLQFAQTSSSTGPGEFKVAYQVNGGGYTDFANYTVLPNQAGAPGLGNWNGTTKITGYNYTFDLSSITALDEATSVDFRLIVRTNADAAPPGTIAAAGTSRVDNVSIIAVVPEPSAAVLGSLGLLALVRRRR